MSNSKKTVKNSTPKLSQEEQEKKDRMAEYGKRHQKVKSHSVVDNSDPRKAKFEELTKRKSASLDAPGVYKIQPRLGEHVAVVPKTHKHRSKKARKSTK